MLGGRPLAAWAVDALRDAGCAPVAVAAKAGTRLPELDAEVWIEPDEPRHPLVGVRHALDHANAAILTVPVDLPLVAPADLLRVASAGDTAVARIGGIVQPLLARLPAGAPLATDGRATDALLALDPVVVDLDGAHLINVNTPDDLRAAEAIVSRR